MPLPIPFDLEEFIGPTSQAFADQGVVEQAVEASFAHVFVDLEIPARVECDVGSAPLTESVAVEMLEGVDRRGGDIGIGVEIEGAVEIALRLQKFRLLNGHAGDCGKIGRQGGFDVHHAVRLILHGNTLEPCRRRR